MTALPHSPIERCVNAEEYHKLRVMILATVHRRKFAAVFCRFSRGGWNLAPAAH
jgi:hypothetical protein